MKRNPQISNTDLN